MLMVVWVKWARPLVFMTLWSRVMFNEKGFLFISWAVLHHWKSMGQLWDAHAPQGCNFYPILRYGHRACQPLQVWWFISFYEILALSYDPPKFAQCIVNGTFGRLFAPGANIVPPIAYKSHSTPFPIRPHVLTPHSWLCDKNCGEE